MENISTSSSGYFDKQGASALKKYKNSLENRNFGDSSIEECCLTREYGIVMSELNNINHNGHTSRTDCIKESFGIKNECVIKPVKSRKRFFKSSRKRQLNVQEIVSQV